MFRTRSSRRAPTSCGGVGSLDLDRRPWLDRPWCYELRDERLGPCPCSFPLADREWASYQFSRRGAGFVNAWTNARWRDFSFLLARASLLAPGPLLLCQCDVSVRHGAFGMRKADGRRWSRRLSLFLTLVLAIVFPQSGYAQIGPVSLVPLDVVEPFPPV